MIPDWNNQPVVTSCFAAPPAMCLLFSAHLPRLSWRNNKTLICHQYRVKFCSFLSFSFFFAAASHIPGGCVGTTCCFVLTLADIRLHLISSSTGRIHAARLAPFKCVPSGSRLHLLCRCSVLERETLISSTSSSKLNFSVSGCLNFTLLALLIKKKNIHAVVIQIKSENGSFGRILIDIFFC